MFIPERSRRVLKLAVPVFALRVGGVVLSLASVLLVILAVDYAHVLAKIAENKRLKGENFKLRQDMQLIRNKVETMENTVERVRNYAKKLQLLTGQESGGEGSALPIGPMDSGDEGGGPADRSPAGKRGRRAKGGRPIGPGSPVSPDLPTAGDNGWQTGSRRPTSEEAEGPMGGGPADDPVVGWAMPSLFDGEAENQRIDSLQRLSVDTEQVLSQLQGYLSAQRAIIAATPSLWPTNGYLSSSYGYRRNPYDGSFRLHAGVDIAAELGTPIRAPASGFVIFSGYREGYGKVVVLDHGYGIRTLFGHTSTLYATPGARVRRGEVIAEVGSTGHSTGPHLHYEIRKNGMPVNPVTFLSRTRF